MSTPRVMPVLGGALQYRRRRYLLASGWFCVQSRPQRNAVHGNRNLHHCMTAFTLMAALGITPANPSSAVKPPRHSCQVCLALHLNTGLYTGKMQTVSTRAMIAAALG